MKVAVIGYSGCGKSTIAAWIAKKNQLPLLYLDTVHWLPGWKERPQDEKEQMMKDFWTAMTPGSLTGITTVWNMNAGCGRRIRFFSSIFRVWSACTGHGHGAEGTGEEQGSL